MGQWLCIPMVLFGIGLWLWAERRPVGSIPAPARR
jgi:phosphatidylglycerol---prolipoprotein diacylglyceryl transferase